MRFGVLGPLAVWTDRGEPVSVPGRKVRALLADLLVHQGRPVSVDRLVEDLWGEATPADPVAALHVRVSQLRRALTAAESGARELVVSQPPGYALRPEPDAVDAALFDALTRRAQETADPHTRSGLWAQALDLWRGAALADFADEEFARAVVARWEEQRLAAVEAHAEVRLELGRHHELAGELGEHVTRHPFRERLRAAHMRALHRSGRQGEALDSFQRLRRGLVEELGVDPGPELTELHQAILAGDPGEDAPAPPPRPVRPATTLPAPVTELIGRDHDLARVRTLLSAGRLVTITGAGGVGKTSVAVAVAHLVADGCPDGAWLVDLTRWDGRGDPAELVLAALSIPDTAEDARPVGERLSAALRERRMLLVLDNCEHVVAPVAELVGSLLPAAPGLRILATSREPLRLRGEARWDLRPLDVPDTDDPDRLARSPAVRLFLARAGLDPTPETTADVTEVCRRLDGIPLALELAAARVPALGIAELATRLRVPQDRFGVLGTGPRDAPARQRTLAAVIDWSWRLLEEPERAVLNALAVHSGGCTLAAVEAVCEGVDSGDVLDLLAGLVDRSLVVRDDGPRYRLLESVAAYTLDRLRNTGGDGTLRRRHAAYYLTLAEEARARLRGPEQRSALHQLGAESANLRAAMDTLGRERAGAGRLRLAVALTWFRLLRGRLSEARRDLEEALAAPGTASALVRADAEAWHAGLAIRQGRAGPERVAEALRHYDAVPDPGARARAAWFLAASTVDFGDEATTGKLLTQALDTFTVNGDRWGEAAVLSTRAMLAHMRGDTDALAHDARRSAALFGELGDEWGVLQATDWQIGLADLTGDRGEAARLGREGLRIAEDLGLWSEVPGLLGWRAWLMVEAGEHAAARPHAREARRLAAEQGQRTAEVFATIALAFAARRDGAGDVAEEHLRWLLAAARRQHTGEGHPPYLSMVLVELGLLMGDRGRVAEALALHREGFDVFRDQGSHGGMAWALAGMAAAVRRGDRPDLAARLLGAADAARHRDDHRRAESDEAELARITADVRAATPGFAAEFARGRELTPERARSLLDGDRA